MHLIWVLHYGGGGTDATRRVGVAASGLSDWRMMSPTVFSPVLVVPLPGRGAQPVQRQRAAFYRSMQSHGLPDADADRQQGRVRSAAALRSRLPGAVCCRDGLDAADRRVCVGQAVRRDDRRGRDPGSARAADANAGVRRRARVGGPQHVQAVPECTARARQGTRRGGAFTSDEHHGDLQLTFFGANSSSTGSRWTPTWTTRPASSTSSRCCGTGRQTASRIPATSTRSWRTTRARRRSTS